MYVCGPDIAARDPCPKCSSPGRRRWRGKDGARRQRVTWCRFQLAWSTGRAWSDHCWHAAAATATELIMTTMMMMDNGAAIRRTCQISAGRLGLADSHSAMQNGSICGGEHQSLSKMNIPPLIIRLRRRDLTDAEWLSPPLKYRSVTCRCSCNSMDLQIGSKKAQFVVHCCMSVGIQGG